MGERALRRQLSEPKKGTLLTKEIREEAKELRKEILGVYTIYNSPEVIVVALRTCLFSAEESMRKKSGNLALMGLRKEVSSMLRRSKKKRARS